MKLLHHILAIIILVLVIILLFSVGSFLMRNKNTYNLTQSSVVQNIQNLSRLETASFTIEKIIEAEKNIPAFTHILFGDRILLIANATISAGFDFSDIDESDIHINNNDISITMPAPQILSSNLNNERTRVYDRRLGIFTKGDLDLESQARTLAEETIRRDACEAGILDSASENAHEQLTGFFTLLGFEGVVLDIPEGVCE